MALEFGKPKYQAGTRLVNLAGMKLTVLAVIKDTGIFYYRLSVGGTYRASLVDRCMKRLCRNCDCPREAHAKHKKCLYGPGRWAP